MPFMNRHLMDPQEQRVFFLKNRDSDRWSDVKSVNAVQINVGKMTDTQLLEELRSDPRVYAAITRQMPELEKITSTVEED